MNTKQSWFQRHPLLGYFLLAYAISWAIGIPLGLNPQGKINWQLPFYVHYLYAFGPMLAAFIMTGFTKGKSGISDIFKRLLNWHMHPVWWIVTFSPLAGYLIIVIIQRFIQGTWIDFSLLGQVNFLPNLGFGALILWIFTFGIGEEIGWRGYALPRLQQKMNALSATLVLGLLWAYGRNSRNGLAHRLHYLRCVKHVEWSVLRPLPDRTVARRRGSRHI